MFKFRSASLILIAMLVQSSSLKANGPADSSPSASFTMDGDLDGSLIYSQVISKRSDYVPESVLSQYSAGMNKRTRFSLLSKGGLANRFYMDVDYRKDDRDLGSEDDSKILMRYLGRPGELLQSLELGDTTLDLPGSRWLSLKGKAGKVSRESFAAKTTLAYQDLKLVMMGSHQKGKPEIETFVLGTNTQKTREIADTAYLQKRFFAIAPAGDLPIDPQSVVLFYDDGNGFNDTSVTQHFVPTGGSKEGSYDVLVPNDPGKGYELDPRTGIARFLYQVPYNSSIVVSYKTLFGKDVKKQLVKADDDSYTTELKNRYTLPGDFLDLIKLSVQDKSGNAQTSPTFSFDTLRGLLIFESTQPFSQEVYQFPPSQNQTIVLSYFSNSEKNLVHLSKEPIAGTIKVSLNGRNLEEGTDFELLPLSGGGEITFYGVHPNDKVTVSYNTKDIPQVRQTVGGGVIFGENKPISIALSGLYDFAPQPTRVPTLGGDAASLKMVGVNLKGQEQFGKLNVTLNMDAAGSQFNPNPYGASMVDNMDSVRRILSVEARDEFWKPSAKPLSASGQRTRAEIGFGSVFLRDIIPNNPSDRREQSMSFRANAGEWFGVHRALAPRKGVVDLRPYRNIEMFVYSEVPGGRLNVEWGDVSEDSNGNGRLDSEDANRDGFIDGNEDTGVGLENGTVYGSGNNLLDTEDIDFNGRLDNNESSNQDGLDLNWSGWKKVRFSLKGLTSARHLRIWVAGPASVKIAQILFTGLEYSEEKTPGSELEISAVSNFSDPDVPVLINNPTFQRLYPERSPDKTDRNESESERLEDFAMSMNYSLIPGGIVSAKKDVQLDLTDNQDIHFFAASTASTNAVFFLRLGDRNNYFEYTSAVSQFGTEYKEFSVSRDRFITVGSPNWQSIREIRVGLKNPGSQSQAGRVFFNEFFVDRPIIRNAIAYSAESGVMYEINRMDDWASLILGKKGNLYVEGTVRQVPRNFRTPDEYLRGQDQYHVSGGWKSDQSQISYAKDVDLERELVSNEGSFSKRLSEVAVRSDKIDWSIRPEVLDWKTGILGSFEKKERSELNLEENVNILNNRLEYKNSRLDDWAPKSGSLDSLYRRDFVLNRNTIGGGLDSKWTLFNGNFSLAPTVSLEETVHSTSNFIVARKSQASLTGEAQALIFDSHRVTMQVTGTTDNSIQRSDYPSLNLTKLIRSEATLSGGVYGQTNVSGNLQKTKHFTSSGALLDPSGVFKYQFNQPSFEAESINQVMEAGVGQNDIRIMNLADLNNLDWISVSLRASVKKENNRFLGTPTSLQSIKFPEAYLNVSTGPWYGSLGGFVEKSAGTDRRGQISNIIASMDYTSTKWQIKNSWTNRTDDQYQTEHQVSHLITDNVRSSVRLSIGKPVYQSIKLIRKNVLLENRLDFSLSGDLEMKRGNLAGAPVDDRTVRLNQRTDYYFKSSFKSYLAVESILYENRLASTRNYAAYSVSLGVNTQF